MLDALFGNNSAYHPSLYMLLLNLYGFQNKLPSLPFIQDTEIANEQNMEVKIAKLRYLKQEFIKKQSTGMLSPVQDYRITSNITTEA
jgi:hypothetical protein